MNLAIEKEFEDSAEDFLTAISTGSEPFTIFKGFDSTNYLTPRAEIMAEGLTFLETLDKFQSGSGLVTEYGKFDIELLVNVVTSISEGHSREQHYTITNNIRNKFLFQADNFNSTNLPNYGIYDIRVTSSQNAIEGENRITSTTFSIRAHIC